MSQSEPALLHRFHSTDERGTFSKPYSYAYGDVPFVIRELFWSASARGTVRGLHVQLPPAAASKLVWVSAGAIVDVLVDLRRGPTFGRVSEFSLTADDGAALFIPPWFAHGFQALVDDTVVNYAQDREFAPESDAGVNWRSTDVTWPAPVTVTSPRDDALPSLAAFASPYGAPSR